MELIANAMVLSAHLKIRCLVNQAREILKGRWIQDRMEPLP